MARTFHSAALRQLVHFWPQTVGGRPPAVLDSKLSLLAEAARAARVPASGPELRDLATEVEWAKVTQVRPEDYPGAAASHRRAPPVDAPSRSAGCSPPTSSCAATGTWSTSSRVLELTAAILGGHRGAGAEVRDRYRYFVVDEYQDVNPLQKLLLDAWLGDRDDLCVVGDPRQTIYSFTGATSAYLTGLRGGVPGRHRGEAGAELPVHAGGRRLREPAGRGRRAPGERRPGRPALVAQRASGPPAEFTEYDDEEAEAAAVAARARQWMDAGAPPRQMAVLVRVNAQTERFERAFAERGRALPGARGRAVLRPGRGAPGDRAAARGGPERAPGDRPRRPGRGPAHRRGCGRGGAAHPRRGRADRRGPGRPGRRPGPLGVAGRAGPACRGPLCRRSRRRPRRGRRRTGPPGQRSSTPRGWRG